MLPLPTFKHILWNFTEVFTPSCFSSLPCSLTQSLCNPLNLLPNLIAKLQPWVTQPATFTALTHRPLSTSREWHLFPFIPNYLKFLVMFSGLCNFLHIIPPTSDLFLFPNSLLILLLGQDLLKNTTSKKQFLALFYLLTSPFKCSFTILQIILCMTLTQYLSNSTIVIGLPIYLPH